MNQQEWVKYFLGGLWVDKVTGFIGLVGSVVQKFLQQDVWGPDTFFSGFALTVPILYVQKLNEAAVRDQGLFLESIL